MPRIVLCCGKVCSGKSTFARGLERDHGYVCLSLDEWMLTLYDPTGNRSEFDRNVERCQRVVERTAEKLLARGLDVVLDSGFWKAMERKATVERFRSKGFDVSLVYFPIEFELQLERMTLRQSDPNVEHYRFDAEAVRVLNTFFEVPDEDEPSRTVEAWDANPPDAEN